MKSKRTKQLSASLEDYLEAIYQISEKKQAAKAKDIASRLGVNKSSVTGALKALAEKELVNYAPYDIITLTPTGRRVAEGVTRRHEILRRFLIDVLSVDAQEAEETACRAEHALTGEIPDRLNRLMDFLEGAGPKRGSILDGFRKYCENRQRDKGAR